MYDAKKENIVFAVGFIILSIIVSINSPGNMNLLKAKFFFVRMYIYVGETVKGISDYITDTIKSYSIHRKTYLENIQLKRELSRLLSENFLLRNRIRDLETIKKTRSEVIPSRIVFWDVRDPYNFIYVKLLKFSSESNVSKGYALDSKGNLMGSIGASIKKNIFSVILITSSNSTVSVYVGRKKAYGIMFGQGRGYGTIKYLKITDPISKGDIVYTTGYDGIYAPNIPVGNIVSIEEKDYYKIAIIEPFFVKTMFSGEEYVEIIKMQRIEE